MKSRIGMIVLSVVLLLSSVILLPPCAEASLNKEGWLWPIPEHKHMSRGFYDGHSAIDLDASKGTPVRATKDGYVIRIYYGCKKDYSSGGYGSCSSSTCSPMVYENLEANNSSSYTATSGSFYSFTSDGKTYKRCNGGYGNGLLIYHSEGSVSSYAHLSSIDESLLTKIKTGKAKVKQGDIIGYVGATGNAFGAHLHFQIGTSYGNWVNNNPNSASLGIKSNNTSGLSVSNGYCYNTNGIAYVFNYAYELIVTAKTGGKIQTELSAKYRPGTKITVTAVPNEGYAFTSWTSNQVTTFSDKHSATMTFTMPAKKTWINGWFCVCNTQSTDVVECTVKSGVHDNNSDKPVSRHIPVSEGQVVNSYEPGDVLISIGTVTNSGDVVYYKLTDGSYIWSELVTPNTIYTKTLKLPSSLTAIGDEAFMGSLCEAIIIPDGCTAIGSKAFANCKNLVYVRVPNSVKSIAADAFAGCGDVIIDRMG